MVRVRRSGGGDRRRNLWLGGARILLAATLWMAGSWNQGPFARLQARETASERNLRELRAPPRAGPLTDRRAHDRDGMQNEDTLGSYHGTLSRQAILDHYSYDVEDSRLHLWQRHHIVRAQFVKTLYLINDTRKRIVCKHIAKTS